MQEIIIRSKHDIERYRNRKGNFCFPGVVDAHNTLDSRGGNITFTQGGYLSLSGVGIVTSGGKIKTNGGGLYTHGGSICTGGGSIDTKGGCIDTQGGNIYTGGGDISTKGGEINTGGGYIRTSDGNIDTGVAGIFTKGGKIIVEKGKIKSKFIDFNKFSIHTFYIGKDFIRIGCKKKTKIEWQEFFMNKETYGIPVKSLEYFNIKMDFEMACIIQEWLVSKFPKKKVGRKK